MKIKIFASLTQNDKRWRHFLKLMFALFGQLKTSSFLNFHEKDLLTYINTILYFLN